VATLSPKQPVIESERQLAGKAADDEVIGVQRRPEYLLVIDAILTLPTTTIEAKYLCPVLDCRD
jgi:hypothetical protein